MVAIQRAEIYLLKEDVAGKARPVLVVSRDQLNQGTSVVVIPFYSQQLERRRTQRYCVPFNAGDGGLSKECVAKADEIGVVDKTAIDTQRGAIGRLNAAQMAEVVKAVRYVLRDDS